MQFIIVSAYFRSQITSFFLEFLEVHESRGISTLAWSSCLIVEGHIKIKVWFLLFL